MVAALCRKRPSPLEQGHAANWAAGVVPALCMVNFGFDESQQPHTTAPTLSAWFGVGHSAPANKSKQIRDLMRLHPMHPEWTRPSRISDNPLIWFITVGGLVIDARTAPRAIQELAFAQGVIPYIPGEEHPDGK